MALWGDEFWVLGVGCWGRKGLICLLPTHVRNHMNKYLCTHLKSLLLELGALRPVPRVGAPVVVVGDVGVEGREEHDAQKDEEDGAELLID